MYLCKKQDGELEVSPGTKRLARIQSQKRWMIDLSNKQHQNKVGEVFMSYADEAAQTMAAVLRAVHYGYDRRVDVEKLTLLLSPAGEPNQILHKDQNGPDTRKKLAGSDRQTRSGQSRAPTRRSVHSGIPFIYTRSMGVTRIFRKTALTGRPR